MKQRLGRVVTSPWLYVAWAGLVLCALPAAYVEDPYLFGFTALGALWASTVITPAGLVAALVARRRSRWQRVVTAAAAVLPAVAVFGAFRMLATFKWN